MNESTKLAQGLASSLELTLPPIAISFCATPPARVSSYDGVAPAGCAFWQQAAARTFATTAKDHGLGSADRPAIAGAAFLST
jgi:hypothetical protein